MADPDAKTPRAIPSIGYARPADTGQAHAQFHHREENQGIRGLQLRAVEELWSDDDEKANGGDDVGDGEERENRMTPNPRCQRCSID